MPVRVKSQRESFVRFVTDMRDAESLSSQGVFSAAYALLESTMLDRHEHEWLTDTIDWYKANLPVPRYFAQRKASRFAICWFRTSAQEKIQRLWDLVHLLKEHGVYIRAIRTTRPGEIVFEDDYQIVAIP